MSIEQSERIRAALLRAKTNRQPSESPALETIEQRDAIPSSAPSEPEASTIFEKRPASDQKPLASERPPAVLPSTSSPAALLNNLRDRAAPVTVVEEPGKGKLKRIILIACTATAFAGLSLLFLWSPWKTPAKPGETGTGTSLALQMRVESQGNGIINIRWNEQSAAIAQAREARMVIMERDQEPRIISLGPDQLKLGHLYYQSPVDRVEFRLEVVEPKGAVAKESVLALASGLAAEPAAGPPVAPVPAGAPSQSNEPTTAKPAPAVEARVEDKVEAPRVEKAVVAQQPSRPVVRPFTPPSVERKSEENIVVLDPPAPVPNGTVVAPMNLPEAAARIAPPPGKDAPPPPKQVKVGGNLQAANLIKRVPPVYPPIAQSMGVQGSVRFTATIGKDGTIQNIQVVSGNPLLVAAASDAVKKWVYRPTLLDGEPVEVITQIEVTFSLKK